MDPRGLPLDNSKQFDSLRKCWRLKKKTWSNKNWNLEKRRCVMKLGTFDVQWKRKRKRRSMTRFPWIESNTRQPCFLVYLSVYSVFSGSKGGGRRWLERHVSLLGQYCHRAEAVWSGPSCELLFLARPSSAGGSDQLRNNRTWTQAWPLSLFLCDLAGSVDSQVLGLASDQWGPRARSPPAAARKSSHRKEGGGASVS